MDNSGGSTPSSAAAAALSLSPSFFDHLRVDDDDDISNFDLATSPTSRRCPTFKEFNERITRLQRENFQLRVRIYLNEHKTGVKTSSADLAVLYQQFQNGGGENGNMNMLLSPSHSTVSITNELDKVKEDKQKLEAKVCAYEGLMAEKDQKISELKTKAEELSQKNTEMSLELQKLNENLAGKRNSEAEIEKLACFAFGQNNDVELLNAEWESKLADKTNEIIELEAELQSARKKLESSDRKTGVLKVNIKEYEKRLEEMSDALKEFGRKYARMERENGKLRKMADKANDNVTEEFSISPNPEKLSALKQLVTLLQGRMMELTNFVETLLQLESKKVFTLTGLSDDNRENLFKAIEQSRMLSKNLDKLFEKDASSYHYLSTSNSFAKESHHGHSHGHHHHGRHRHHSSSTDSQYRGIFSPLERVRHKTSEVQCNILDASLINSVESANAYINRLKQDIVTLEHINSQLGAEKTDLMTQVKSLESSANVLRMTNHAEKSASSSESINSNHANSKLQEENRKLLKRLTVTEDALRHLHVQHAKLVGELKTLRSTYQKSSKTSVGSTVVESSRPADSTSPDLGIDSGHDGAVNSDDSNSTNYKEENRILRTTNRELALKLKQTRQALDITLEKLNSTTKEKEQVEKAICRQLHKTHTILRQAKKSVEKFTNSQCQENIVPSSP